MVRRGIAGLLAVSLLAVPMAQPVSAADRADEWRALAVTALGRFEAGDAVGDGGTGSQKVMSYGLAFEASGRLRGFTDIRTQRYLAKILSMKNPDGGYGLNFAYDVLGDGTVNPPTTTYTVTLADHVGSPLLLGYLAGAVPRAEVQNIVNLLMSTPRIDTDRGQCIAYSRHPNDSVPYACVHNVNAGAARFLLEAQSAGIGRSGLAALVEGVTRRETAAFEVSSRNWHYADTPHMTDPPHLAYQAYSMARLAPQLGTNVAYTVINTDYAPSIGLAGSAVAHAFLVPLPAGIAGYPAPAAHADRWCVLGDRWLPEVQAYVNALPNIDGAAQLAQLTAKAADACGP